MLELLDEFLMRHVDFCIGQSPFGAAVGERISDALVLIGHVLAAKDIEQFDVLKVGRFGFSNCS